jgi:NuA3 HAT complex component NTO1
LKLRERYYTSVSEFSQALSLVISERMDSAANKDVADTSAADINAISSHLNEVKPGTAEHMALTQEQKDIKRLAKRILKAVKEPLEDAFRKEAELKGLERDEVMKRLDALPIFAATKALELEGDPSPVKKGGKHRRAASDISAAAGASPDNEDEEMPDADADLGVRINGKKSTPTSEAPGSRASSRHGKNASLSKPASAPEPLSPPTSTSSSSAATSAASGVGQDAADVFAHGGVPWYLEQFDPIGTTVHEERYTGREVLRGMSEELSDMDEDTLTELKVSGSLADAETPRRSTRGSLAAAQLLSGGVAKKEKRPKKKGRRAQWTKPRVR